MKRVRLIFWDGVLNLGEFLSDFGNKIAFKAVDKLDDLIENDLYFRMWFNRKSRGES